MASRIMTPVTNKVTSSISRIRSEIGNFPTNSTKFTVIHKRPIFNTQTKVPCSPKTSANTHCQFAQHPVRSDAPSKSAVVQVVKSSDAIDSTSASDRRKSPPAKMRLSKRSSSTKLKRSLSADSVNDFMPMPAKRPFPVRIWFNQKPAVRLPVATAYWLDSPLFDATVFVHIKLLEASQAHRYLQLQGRPRKYLHLTGGGIQTINIPPRKAEPTLPPMTIRLRPAVVKEENPTSMPGRKNNLLPPPPPLISLRKDLGELKGPTIHSEPQEEPLELCKRRKSNDRDSPGFLPPQAARSLEGQSKSSPTRQPHLTQTNGSIKRKSAIPSALPITKIHMQEPLDLASPSPTNALKRMTLSASPSSPPASPVPSDDFRRRLALVLQVLLGHRRLQTFGHPEVSIEDVLKNFLTKAGVTPSHSVEVRDNWIKFLRLCVKNDEAWRREGWDHKSPDAILDEIYVQDVIPILQRKAEPSSASYVANGNGNHTNPHSNSKPIIEKIEV